MRGAPHHGAPSAITPELEAAVSLQVREGLRRVIAEIQSSRGFYSARPDARQIGGVVLTGAMTTWPGVAELLRDELNLPVLPAGRDNWPDLGTVSVAPERLDVAVGLALAVPDDRPDLSPARTSPTRQLEAAPNARVAQAVCAVAAVLAAAIVYMVVVSNEISSGKERLVAIGNELAVTEKQAADLKPYATFAQATIERREAVTTIAKARFDWDKMLIQLARVAPGDVWLTTASATVSSTTAVEGARAAGSLRSPTPAPRLSSRAAAGARATCRSTCNASTRSPASTRSASTAPRRQAARPVRAHAGMSRRASSFTLVTYFDQSPELAALAAQTGTPGVAPAATAAAPAPAATTPAPAGQTPTTPAGATK